MTKTKTKTISPEKLTDHRKALAARHAEYEAELKTLLATSSSQRINADRISELKQRKCAVKKKLEAIDSAVTTARSKPAAPVTAPDDDFEDALIDELIAVVARETTPAAVAA